MDINKGAGKLYDLSSVLAISEHNPSFLAKLILVFCDNISNDILLIKEAANNGNWHEAGHLAHKMKPSLAHFGVNSVSDIILALEHPGNNNPQHLRLLVAELDGVIIKVLDSLKSEYPDVFNNKY